MSEDDDIIVALATSNVGSGALGIVRMSGKGSIDLANKFVDIDLKNRGDHTINLCHFIDENGEIVDELLALLFFDGRSYTKEEGVEFSCHNSKYILEKVIKTLIDGGARMAEPGEFTKRAFMNGRFDLVQAEAVADLIASKTKAAHDIAFYQMDGKFSKILNDIKDSVVNVSVKLEASINFEDIEEIKDENEIVVEIENIKNKVKKVLDSFEKGEVIKNGLPIAIVGRPNVGKSSLLNALLGEERVIVSPIAGTTRDTIDAEVVIGGVVCRFIDTAGLREDCVDIVEKMGIERTKKVIEKAKLIFLVVEVGMSKSDILSDFEEIKKLCNGKKIVVIVNKIDLDRRRDIDSSDFGEDFIGVSALNGENISKIGEYIEKNFGVGGCVFAVNERHRKSLVWVLSQLQEVCDCIKNGVYVEIVAEKIKEIVSKMRELMGECGGDVLDEVFSKFCIGK